MNVITAFYEALKIKFEVAKDSLYDPEFVAKIEKIRKIIDATLQNPYEGIGKPEALKYNLTGCWSRRINKEHRIVYEVFEDKIIVHSLKGHY